MLQRRSVNRATAIGCSRFRTTSGTTASGGRSGCGDLITSTAAAELAGIAPDHSVYPLVALESSQSLSLSRRADLHRWPAMGVLGRAAGAQLGEPLTAIEHVELYRVSRRRPGAAGRTRTRPRCDGHHHGWDAVRRRPVQQLRFQATVAMVERLRERPGERGCHRRQWAAHQAGPHRVGNGPQRSMHAIDLVTDVRASTDVAARRGSARCRGDRHLHDRRSPGCGDHRSRGGKRAVAACDDEALLLGPAGGPDRHPGCCRGPNVRSDAQFRGKITTPSSSTRCRRNRMVAINRPSVVRR